MISNLVKLYGSPNDIDAHQKWKLDLVKYVILDPTDAMAGALTITSGFRTHAQQAGVDPSRAAKGVSQHELAEAVDFVCEDMDRVHLWMYFNIRWWQLILYVNRGTTTEIHASIVSESPTVEKKALVNTDGTWTNFVPPMAIA